MWFLDFKDSVGFSEAVIGFSARKISAGGTGSGDTIANYDTVDWDSNSGFNSTTGIYTIPETAIYFFGMHSFPNGGTPAGTTVTATITRNTAADVPEAAGNYASSSGHGSALYGTSCMSCTSGDEMFMTQTNDTLEEVRFFCAKVVTDCAFSASSTGSGSSGDVIASLTEDFDEGGDFNPTTGVFTAPEDGNYIISGRGACSSPLAAGSTWTVQPQLNGTNIADFTPVSSIATTSTHSDPNGHSLILNLSSGDEIQWRQLGTQAIVVRLSAFKLPTSTSVFSAYKADASGDADNDTVANWDGTRVNVGGHFDATTGIYTAPANGIYHFMGTCNGTSTAAAEGQANLMVNGTKVATSRWFCSNASFTGCPGFNYVLSLTAGDEVTLEKQNFDNDCNFGGWRIA